MIPHKVSFAAIRSVGRSQLLKSLFNAKVQTNSISTSISSSPFRSFYTVQKINSEAYPRANFHTFSRTFANSSRDNDGRVSEASDEEERDGDSSQSTSTNSNSDSESESELFSSSENEVCTLSQEEIKELAGDNQETEKKIQFILMELELLRQEGGRVPSKIKMKHWPELISLRSKGQRLKFYSYLWKTEMKSLSELKKKQERMQKRIEEMEQAPRPTIEEDPHWMTYGLNRNSIFMRTYDSTIVTVQSHRIISEMVLGASPLVLDCGYDEHMVFREAKNCASQIELSITDNRTHPQPFNLVLCNANANSKMMTQLVKRIPTLYDPGYALNITEKSYMDLYPRDRLVYLSPHAREEMKDFDHDDIYIVGAIVDKSDPRPFSLAKTKKDGIRIKKLPLDSLIDWGLGNKSLTINQVVSIMLELRATGDWEKALRFVPRRKLIGGRTIDPQPSRVLKDYELMANRKRGFRQYENDENLEQRGRPSRNGLETFGKYKTRHSVKTIMSDY